jgi:outer membrane protein TolC
VVWINLFAAKRKDPGCGLDAGKRRYDDRYGVIPGNFKKTSVDKNRDFPMSMRFVVKKGMIAMLWFVAACQMEGNTQDLTLHSVDDAINLALSRNIDYQNYVLNQQKAGLEFKQSKSYRMPQIRGSMSGQRNIDLPTTPIPGEFIGEPGQSVYVQFGQKYTYNAGISISQKLINREAKLNAKMVKLGSELAEVEKQVFEELLKEQVSLYYYTGLIATKAIQIGEQDLESAEKVSLLTQQKYEQGIVDIISLNTSKINENSVRQNLNSSKQLELQCVIELKKLFGMGVSDSLILAGKFDYLMPDLYGVHQLQTNSQLKVAVLQVEQADIQLKSSQAALLPTLSFDSYFGKQQFRDDFGMEFGNDAWSNYAYISLNLSVPIFTGFNKRSKINEYKVKQQIAMNDKQEVAHYAALEDEMLIADYQLSVSDAQAALETYLLYRDNKELTFQKYEEGVVGLDSYHAIFEEYLQAENAYLNAMSKVYTYYSQILPRIQS